MSDFEVLLELYHVTKGQFWIKNWNWDSHLPYNKYHGVTATSAGGHVEELILRENRLQGCLTDIISWRLFANLKVLCLNDNLLCGILPDGLKVVSTLHTLDLSWNQFTGEIPDGIYELTNLSVLKLESNQLEGEVSPRLGNLVNLRFLNLSRNRLSGQLPPVAHMLPHLEIINLSENQFEGPVPSLVRDYRMLSELHDDYEDVLADTQKTINVFK